MRLWEFFKHATVGGVVMAIAESRLAEYLDQQRVPEGNRPKYKGIILGAVGGGTIGYYVGEQIANHDREYTVEEKLASTAIGAAGGGIAGGVLGSYLGKRIASRSGGRER